MLSETLRRREVSKATRSSFLVACVLLSIASIIPHAHAQTTNLVLAPVDPGNRVTLKGHHPAWASALNDAGAVSSDLALERLTIVLNRPPQVEAAFTQFLADQQNPKSPNYHHWLTPVEIGKRFGVSDHDITAVKGWLESQNLTVASVSDSRVRISFSGTAANVGRAFGSEMRYFTVRSEKRISIAGEAQIPAGLSGVIKSISGLYTLKLHPQHRLHSDIRVSPEGSFTCSGGVPCNIIFPGDFATIYNAGSGGVDGTGQTIAIIGRSQVCTSDITGFAGLAAVTINGPNLVVPTTGSQPAAALCTGATSSDQDEATLDVTRSGSVAQGAKIDLVASGGSATGDGVDVAAQYVVDTPSLGANIMSISFGGCESDFGRDAVTFYDGLFQQAAGQGISVFVSSGDSGAAGCDASFNPPPPSQQLSPNALCASSYATCVGGTEFADRANPSMYWSSTNGTGFSSALSYIPEGAWNEPGTAGAFIVAATGGGVSGVIPTPSWQTGTGVPAGRTGRYTPDVSFSAAGHDGYFACLAAGGACSLQTGVGAVVFSGTSASAPDMAGIAALLNQSRGSAQGLLNPDLYGLAATPANGIFHDVTVASSAVSGCVVTTPSMCNNSTPTPAGITPGFSGYLITAGYDEATGLGSLNVGNLLSNWPAATQTTVQSSASPALPGTSITFTATVTATSGTPTGNVTFMDGSTSLSTMALTNGTAAFTTSSLAFGFHPITAVYAGNALAFAVSKSQTLQQAVGTLSQTTLQTSAPLVGAGTSVTFTAVVAPQSGTGSPTGMVAFMDKTATLGTASITGGTAVLSISTLRAGTHSVTAVYQGDTTFLQSTSPIVSQSVVDISVTATTPASVVAGGNGSFSVAVTPSTGFSPTVNVTCAGAPSESTCTVGAPNPPTGAQTFPVSITTTAPHSLRQITPMGMFIPFGFLLPLGGMFLAVTGNRTRRNLGWLGLTLLLTISTLWLSACGGSSKKDPGTPPGTYSLMVTTTATSGAITISKPTTVMLTVTAQ